jgi:hypothetical protein
MSTQLAAALAVGVAALLLGKPITAPVLGATPLILVGA